LGEPGKYHKVPSDKSDSKQAFEDLAQRLTSREMLRRPETERRAIRDAAFVAIKAGYEQVRSIIRQVSQQPKKLVERLRKKKIISTKKKLPAAPSKEKKSETKDPLRALVDDTPATDDTDLADLHAVVADAAKSKDVAPALLEIVEELDEEEKEAKRQQRPLERIRAAAKSLEKIELDSATEGLAEISRALGRVFEEAERLRALIEEIRGNEGSK
jgi:hypothetical protein